jgi:hypothetical protein
MKTKGILVVALAILGSTTAMAQGGRPGGRPVNPGQERAAEVKLRNAENKTAKAEGHSDKRQHGEATAQSHANEKGLKNSNENSALKGTGKHGAEADHKEHADKKRGGDRNKDGEVRKDGEKRGDGDKRKDGEKRKDGDKKRDGDKKEGQGTNG